MTSEPRSRDAPPSASLFLAAGNHVVVQVGVGIGSEARRLLALVRDAGRVIGVESRRGLIASDVLPHPRFTLVPQHGKEGATAVGAILSRPADVVIFVSGPGRSDPFLSADIDAFLPLLRPGGLALFLGVKLDEPHGIRRLWQERLHPGLAGAHSEHVHAIGSAAGSWWRPPGESFPTNVRQSELVKHEQRWAELPAAVEGEVSASLALAQLAEGLYCHGQRTGSLTDVLKPYLAGFEQLVARLDVGSAPAIVRFLRTLRYHGLRKDAVGAAQKAWDVFARATDEATRGIGIELAFCRLESGDLAGARSLLRGLHERWPADLDVAYHLVAVHGATADPSIAQVADQVFARAASGRVPCTLDARGSRHALAQLQRERFVFLKGAVSAPTVARLSEWADGLTVDGHLRGSDGRLGPAQWQDLFEDMQTSGLRRIADDYLGGWFAHPDSYVKVLGGNAGHMAWHQDGGTSNSPRRYGTFWLALHPCGVDRPGIEIVSYPLSTILAAGPVPAPRAAYPWSLDESLLPSPTRWAPPFEPGDLLVFHKYVPHATQLLGRPSPSRSSVDFRLHSETFED
ncbi:MAG TPA: hypothetical protein VGG33_01280 [Polyangia bacterium]